MNGNKQFLKKTVKAAALLLVFWALSGCEDNLLNTSGPSQSDLSELTQPPPRPGPSLTPEEGRIYLQFTRVVGADGYRIYWNTISSPNLQQYMDIPQSQPETNQLVDGYIEGLTNGREYWVWAASMWPDGRSNLSESDHATPRLRPSAPPSGFSASANNEALDLYWTNVPDADSYEVAYSATGEAPEDAETAQFSAWGDGYPVKGYLTGLNKASTYTIWIRSVNNCGKSAYSAPITPQAGTTLGTVGNIDLRPGDGSLRVLFAAVNNASGYKLYHSENSDMSDESSVTVPAGAGQMNVAIPNLVNKTTYWVQVAAVNGGNESSRSGVQNAAPIAKPAVSMSNNSMLLGTAAERFPNEEAGHGDRLSRKKETALGNLVTDAMYEWAVNHKDDAGINVTKIDFAFVNGGVIKVALPKGPITVGTLNHILYSDAMSIITMTGANIKRMFNERVGEVPHNGGGGKGTGAFGQVSKQVHFSIDYKKPLNEKITSLQIYDPGTEKYADFVDTTEYTFVTSTYLIQDNTDGYVPYLGSSSNQKHTGKVIGQAVAEWIYAQDMVPIKPTQIDGRLYINDPAWQ
jgi:hypothetical protein